MHVTIEPAQREHIKMIVTHAVSVGIAALSASGGRAVFVMEGQAKKKCPRGR